MTGEYWRNNLKDDDVLHYDKTLIRQIRYGFIFFGDAEAGNYTSIQVVSVTNYTKNTSKGYLNDYYVYLDGSQLDSIVSVSGRPDIEVRIDLPG